MGHDQTSVIDAQTTTVEATSRLAVRRRRPAIVAAAAAGVIALAVGAVVWSTSGSTPTSAESRATGTPRSSAPAAVSDAAPSVPAAPVPPGGSETGPKSSAAPSAAKPSTPAAAAPVPPAWTSRTFQGVTFAVPPGATAPDLQDPGNADAPATFAWTGPAFSDGVNAQITIRFYPADQAPAPAPEYRSVTVPGADQAHVRTGTISDPPLTAVDVQVLWGGRFVDIVGMFAAGPDGEQMARALLASLSVG